MLTKKQIQMLLNDTKEPLDETNNFKKRELSSQILFKYLGARNKIRPFTSTQTKKQRIFSSTMRQNSIKKNQNLELNVNNFDLNTNTNDVNVLNLIIQTSPTKYDPNLLNKKLKKLNDIYEEKRKNYSKISRVDELYYKYNILYGTKSNQIIRSYSPKMRPQSASLSNYRKDALNSDSENEKCFTLEEMKKLFKSKCDDLNIKFNTNLEQKFYDFCNKKCVNRVINFEECNLGIKSAEVLSNILSYNQNVSHLKLSKNSFKDESIHILMNVVKGLHNIVSLELGSNDLTHKGGEIIFEALLDQHSIISLDLTSFEGTNRNRLTADGVKKLEILLKTNFYLESLKLGGNSLKNKGMKYLILGLNNNSTLHFLDISNNEINCNGISYISYHLNSSKLTELDLSLNPICDSGIEILSNCLVEASLNNLKKLNLTNCKISADGLVFLFSILQNNKRLENLNLNKNNFSGEKFDYLKNYLYLVNLKELKMASCKIGDRGATVIAEGLFINSSIKNIDLSDNKISDKGFQHFIDVPIKNLSLESLDLSKNMISDLSCKEFTDNLVKSSINKLNFFDNQLRNETGTSLIQAIRANKNIIKVNVKLNRMHTRITDEIKRLLKINSENSKLKFIPNLKREIRQNFVDQTDFEETEKKIQELGDKLKEDLNKFSNLKILEEEKLKKKVEDLNSLNKSLKEYEDNLKKLNYDQKYLQNQFTAQSENLNKEIYKIQDIIKSIEIGQKETKISLDILKHNYESELFELNYEFKKSEEKMNTAFMTMESIKKELKNKNNLLEKLQKNEEEERIKTETINSLKNTRKNSQNNFGSKNSILLSKRDSTLNDLSKKSSKLLNQLQILEINNNFNKMEANHKNSKENIEDKKKSRPKSHNPLKKPPRRYKLKKPNI